MAGFYMFDPLVADDAECAGINVLSRYLVDVDALAPKAEKTPRHGSREQERTVRSAIMDPETGEQVKGKFRTAEHLTLIPTPFLELIPVVKMAVRDGYFGLGV